MKFSELKIKPQLIESLQRLKLDTPTEVQEKAIPLCMKGTDLIVRSKTGSGKTFAFLLPTLERITPDPVIQALILTPTRELAQQVEKEARKLDRNVKTALLYGGVAIGPQIERLRIAQLVVATPGRVLDHLQRGTIDFDHIRFAILDEADRMLDMGFIDDVQKILQATPDSRQTLLFSATMPPEIVHLSERYMRNPEQLLLQQDEITVDKIRQKAIGVERRQKLDVLVKLLKKQGTDKVMIFVNTKDWAKRLAEILHKKRFKVTSIHSGLTQKRRNHVIQDFNSGRYNILVATDVAARGLHINDVTHVINYDIPRNPKDYVHRIGRTGRAGKEGDAITFVTGMDEPYLKAVESEINMFLDIEYVNKDGKKEVLKRQAPVPAKVDSLGDDWGLD